MSATPSISAGLACEHFAYIDLLRGIAIFGVLAAHSGMGLGPAGLTQLPFHLDWLLGAGKHGVALFFVISAYALIRSMNIRYNRHEPLLGPYLVRRFFRIAPAYYLILLLVFLLYGKGFEGYTPPDGRALTWSSLTAHLLFVNGLFPYYTNDFLGVEWSITTEFMFYSLLPFIFLWLRRSGSNWALAAKACALYLTGLALLWFMYFKSGYVQSITGYYPDGIFGAWTYFFLLSHIHEFAAGIAAWVAIKIAEDSPFARPGPATAGLALTALVASGIVLACFEVIWRQSFHMVVGGQVLWGLLSAGLVLTFAALRLRPIPGLTFLGKISFSLYLVHMPVFYGLSQFPATWRVTDFGLLDYCLYLAIAWSLSLAAATLLFHFVEKRGMRVGQALLTRFSQPIFAT